MQLNEQTARLDSNLEAVCKKIEKIELETRGHQEGANDADHQDGGAAGNLTYKVNYQGPGSKCFGALVNYIFAVVMKSPICATSRNSRGTTRSIRRSALSTS